MRSIRSWYTRGSAKLILSPYGVCEAARPGRIMNADIYVALGETSLLEGLDVEDAWLRLPRNFHSSVLGHSCSTAAGSSPSSAEQR